VAFGPADAEALGALALELFERWQVFGASPDHAALLDALYVTRPAAAPLRIAAAAYDADRELDSSFFRLHRALLDAVSRLPEYGPTGLEALRWLDARDRLSVELRGRISKTMLAAERAGAVVRPSALDELEPAVRRRLLAAFDRVVRADARELATHRAEYVDDTFEIGDAWIDEQVDARIDALLGEIASSAELRAELSARYRSLLREGADSE
jgi:hypothetical protein